MKKYLIPSICVLLILITAISYSISNTAGSVQDEDEKVTISSQYVEFNLVKIVDGLDYPWALAFLPDGRKIVTEKPGSIKIVDNGNLIEVSGAPEVLHRSQGGLMDIVLHPDYEENGWIYMTYSMPNDNEETATALARAQLDGTRLINLETLFHQNYFLEPRRHYGSRIAWTNEGKLIMSVGDRGFEPERAQDLMDHAGTVLRLNDDGTAPDDNPFVDNENALDEIYSYGHRNIQGLIVNPHNQEIWATEHGTRGGDLLHHIKPGLNYGWPYITQGRGYSDDGPYEYATGRSGDGVEPPVYEMLPAHPPSGLALVTSDNFPEWKGSIMAGGLRSERIRRLRVEDVDGQYEVVHDEELLLRMVGRIRDVREGPNGNIYILTDSSNGAIYRMEPAD